MKLKHLMSIAHFLLQISCSSASLIKPKLPECNEFSPDIKVPGRDGEYATAILGKLIECSEEILEIDSIHFILEIWNDVKLNITGLMLASQFGLNDIVSELINLDADVNAQNSNTK